MTKLLLKFSALNTRERALIALMLALALTIGGFYGLYKPAHDYYLAGQAALSAARTQTSLIDGAVRTQAHLSARRAQLKGTSAAGAGGTDPRTAVTRVARALGVTLTRLQPDTDTRLNVWIDAVDAPTLFQLLRQMKAEHGVFVRKASLETSNKAGLLRAQILLAAGNAS